MNKRIPCKRCSGRGFINWTFSEGNTGTATSYICPDCNGRGDIVVPMTNAERIRSMSDEELAERFTDATYYKASSFSSAEWAGPNGGTYSQKDSAKSEWVKWLRQPAEEEQL